MMICSTSSCPFFIAMLNYQGMVSRSSANSHVLAKRAVGFWVVYLNFVQGGAPITMVYR